MLYRRSRRRSSRNYETTTSIIIIVGITTAATNYYYCFIIIIIIIIIGRTERKSYRALPSCDFTTVQFPCSYGDSLVEVTAVKAISNDEPCHKYLVSN